MLISGFRTCYLCRIRKWTRYHYRPHFRARSNYRQWVPSFDSNRHYYQRQNGQAGSAGRRVVVTIDNPRRGTRGRRSNPQNVRRTSDSSDKVGLSQERINPKITIISDSICGRISIPGVDFQVIGGLNIDRCYEYIERGERLKVLGYDIIVLHIGTVELRKESAENFVARLQELIKLIRSVNTECHIGLSSIIPRPIDFHSGSSGRVIEANRKEFNLEIQRVALWERCNYLRSYKPFLNKDDQSYPDESLFRKIWLDGVHTNWYGSRKLESYQSG